MSHPAKIRKTVTNDMVVKLLSNKDNVAIIKSVLRGFAHQLDEHTLQACADTAVYRVLRYHDENYPGGISLKTALRRMTKRVCINAVHATNSYKGRQELAMNREIVRFSNSNSNAEDSIEKVHQLLDDMPEHFRQVLHLYYFEGRSYIEMAQLLQMSPEHCKKQVTIALQFAKFLLDRSESVCIY